MIQLRKFSWRPKDHRVVVTYVVINEETKDRVSCELECPDAPKPELLATLESLEQDALEECEVLRVRDKAARAAADRLLGSGYMEREHDPILAAAGIREAHGEVRSVSWSWSHDIMGASICLLVELQNSNTPLVVNTPHKPVSPYSEGGADHLLPAPMAEKLRRLHSLVEAYIAGDRVRQQTDMFDEEDES